MPRAAGTPRHCSTPSFPQIYPETCSVPHQLFSNNLIVKKKKKNHLKDYFGSAELGSSHTRRYAGRAEEAVIFQLRASAANPARFGTPQNPQEAKENDQHV